MCFRNMCLVWVIYSWDLVSGVSLMSWPPVQCLRGGRVVLDSPKQMRSSFISRHVSIEKPGIIWTKAWQSCKLLQQCIFYHTNRIGVNSVSWHVKLINIPFSVMAYGSLHGACSAWQSPFYLISLLSNLYPLVPHVVYKQKCQHNNLHGRSVFIVCFRMMS